MSLIPIEPPLLRTPRSDALAAHAARKCVRTIGNNAVTVIQWSDGQVTIRDNINGGMVEIPWQMLPAVGKAAALIWAWG